MDPSANPTPEVTPEPAPQPERGDQQTGPEKAPGPDVERERKEEVQPEQQPGEGAAVLPPVQPPPTGDDQLTIPITPQVDDDQIGGLPAVAEDVDVIEKEWVNKAKQVIAQTRNDPHAQEAAFEKLQKEYLKKRYDKEIKAQA